MPSALPLLSVVVPVRNAAPFLDEFFASLAAQRFGDFELIVVDDGSTDGSADIVAAWLGRFPSARLLRQERRGPYVARNRGLDVARGRWLAFADADDVLEPDLYARVMARTQGADVVACNGAFWHPAEERRSPMVGLPAGERRGADFLAEQVGAGGFRGNEWLYCVRRDLVERHRLRHIEASSKVDVAWTAAVLLRSNRLVFIDEPLYRYRQHRESLSHGRTDSACGDAVRGHLANATALDRLWRNLPDGDAAARRAVSRLIQDEGYRIPGLLRAIDDPDLRRALRQVLRGERVAAMLWRHASTFRDRRRAVRSWVDATLFGRD